MAGHSTPRLELGRLLVFGWVAPIKLLNVNPTYPPAARQAGIQGDVMAYCVIGVDGVLLEAVLSRQWTYNPDEVVETVIGVFPEIEAWWVDKTVGPHLYFWWAR